VGFDEYVDGDGVSLIEWASRIEEILPPDTRRVTIEKDLSKGLDYRRITLE
jgi:tRNA threonylcarbamoyladenosine biosynthesis protein TsaE